MQLISEEYKQIQAQVHKDKPSYGTSGKRYVEHIMHLSQDLKSTDILDYGCGKGLLQQNLPFTISQYDPAIMVYSLEPAPADIVVCTDVLEHIEPECLDNVLQHIASKIKVVGYFAIHGGKATKHLPDGRNMHLIVEDKVWWFNKISQYFTIGSYTLNFNKDDNSDKMTEQYVFLVNLKQGVDYEKPQGQ